LILWVLDIRRRKMIQEDTPPDPCRKRKICFFDQECFCFFS
jgi:hypothetical protein